MVLKKAAQTGGPLCAHCVTRREWALRAAVAMPVAAQVTQKTPPQGTPAPPKPPATPEDRLKKAYSDVSDVRTRLAQISVAMDVEPAFLFRAIV